MSSSEALERAVMRPYYLAKARDARREARISFWTAMAFAVFAAVHIAIGLMKSDWDTLRAIIALVLALCAAVWARLWRVSRRREADWMNRAA